MLPSARRDTTASSGMLTGHQNPLWMFASLRGSTPLLTIPQIMINVFSSEHSNSLETLNSSPYVVIPLPYIVLDHSHYSVASLQHFQPPTFASGDESPPQFHSNVNNSINICSIGSPHVSTRPPRLPALSRQCRSSTVQKLAVI
jgi:hypothetical protein